jgi:hypothetical protein
MASTSSLRTSDGGTVNFRLEQNGTSIGSGAFLLDTFSPRFPPFVIDHSGQRTLWEQKNGFGSDVSHLTKGKELHIFDQKLSRSPRGTHLRVGLRRSTKLQSSSGSLFMATNCRLMKSAKLAIIIHHGRLHFYSPSTKGSTQRSSDGEGTPNSRGIGTAQQMSPFYLN